MLGAKRWSPRYIAVSLRSCALLCLTACWRRRRRRAPKRWCTPVKGRQVNTFDPTQRFAVLRGRQNRAGIRSE
ncbi:hypothetical protein C8R46DRAFT_1065551 [Mycena filopes]|nr:hypothetical protein C8R46DRAFT_1065551 [Mycena filopes]